MALDLALRLSRARSSSSRESAPDGTSLSCVADCSCAVSSEEPPVMAEREGECVRFRELLLVCRRDDALTWSELSSRLFRLRLSSSSSLRPGDRLRFL